MKNILNDKINQCSVIRIKSYDADAITLKIYNRLLDNKKIKASMNEFENKTYNEFYKSLIFHLGRTLTKYGSSKEIIEWKLYCRDHKIMNNSDNEESTIKTREIIKDFIIAESQKALERISILQNKEFVKRFLNGKSSCYDYSLVSSADKLNNYKSQLFIQDNCSIIRYYYCDFIWDFPVTLAEFERTFFYLLTHIGNNYPINAKSEEINLYITEINNLVQTKYIDVNDIFIKILLYIFTYDDELQKTCNDIYKEIENIGCGKLKLEE
jgi:hypothetical protein